MAGAMASGLVPNNSLVPKVIVSGPFGAVAQGHAGHAHDRGFFGDATGVGDYCFASFDEIVEFEVAQRFCQMK